VALCLTACTPAFNWREVQHPDGLWSATFPDKPLQVTRTLSLPQAEAEPIQGVTVTLWSSRVGEQTFTISLSEAPEIEPEVLRNALARARRLNIGLTQAPKAPGEEQIGTMRLDPSGPQVPARLQMKSQVVAGQVLEAIVAGPLDGFDVQAAETFLQSAVFLKP
jgi:hypothetical protein